jgi:RNA polymerase II subunit A-like phosphatase
MQYSFKWTTTVGDHILGETWEEEQVTVADWDSPADGEIQQWRIKEGEVIERDGPCLVVQEACPHDIQFQGLCAICGKDMTEVNWASESRDTDRAPINMTHDQTSLTVSALQAQRAEQELQHRLLGQRKLSLVVDLDQTIIHACIEPTIGEWQRDPSNPNYESVKDVKSFQLNDDGPRGLATGCWYYIKMRPGLESFLDKIADLYELHVYTMGTRAYALNIARIVDPQQKLFGNRVISRDENGSMTAKSLQRLFPVSTDMVVIIDDRADVWPRNRPNLIKVNPYDFFKGIGDINSSFLPKREDLLIASPTPSPPPQQTTETPTPVENGVAAGSSKQESTPSTDVNGADKVSALEELAKMSGGDDPMLTQRQIEEQARTLEKQIVDRPLLHLQEQLDKEDEEAEKTADTSNGDELASSQVMHHRQLLSDDDDELAYLEQHLTSLHRAYYEEYDRNATIVDGLPTSIPDVGQVLSATKARVLRGTKIVLSGLVPIGVDVKRSEFGLQAASFGAEIRDKIGKDVTHLVISSSRPRTQKVRQAAKIPSIKIVNQDWLAACLTQWERVDEAPYLVDVHPADRLGGEAVAKTGVSVVSSEMTDAETISDADDDSEDENATVQKKLKPRLQIVSETGHSIPIEDYDDSEPDEEDLDEEVEAGLLPSELAEGQLSPVDGLKTFNWGEADEELDEFLASGSDDDDEDDDGNSTNRDSEANDEEDESQDNDASSRKRKHAGDGEDDVDSDEPNSEAEGSIDAQLTNKKPRLAVSNTPRPRSNLRTEYTPGNDDADGSLPTPQITGDEDEAAVSLLSKGVSATDLTVGASAGGDDFDINEDELEAELMAEFEAEDIKMRELEQATATEAAEKG